MHKLMLTLPRYMPLIKILAIVGIAVVIAIAGGAPDVFDI
jgi:hypothetical protein